MRVRLCVVFLVLLVAAACGKGAGITGTGRQAAGSPTPRPRPLPPIAHNSSNIKDSVFHVGQEAFITDRGLIPGMLVTIMQEKISFINETKQSHTIVLDVLHVTLGPIPPGGRVSYTPCCSYSIAYHVAENHGEKAQIQVEPYFDPGEDPAAENRHNADTPGETRSPAPSP
jgi:hypothetical protein